MDKFKDIVKRDVNCKMYKKVNNLLIKSNNIGKKPCEVDFSDLKDWRF